MRLVVPVAILFLPLGSAVAQESAVLPMQPTGAVSFTADAGTALSLDVSADGKTILFDLLGDIYSLSITGGKAHALTTGLPWDAFPRYSPDGSQIAFVSDRSGLDNLWVMQANGSDAHMVTHYTDVVDEAAPFKLMQPVWSADGQSLTARRKAQRNAYSADETWVYGVASGEGHVVQATYPNPAIQSSATSPDGHWQSIATATLDAQGLGTTQLKLKDLSAASAPDVTLSEDIGRILRSTTWWTWPQLQAFTPDSRALIFVSYGKLHRIDLATRAVTDIPFEASVVAEHGRLNRSEIRLDDGPLHIKQLRSIHQSADGTRTLFAALGRIWMQEPGYDPHRLTGGKAHEFDPVFSPDGRFVAYVTYSAEGGGDLKTVATRGGKPREVLHSPSRVYAPQFTRDGTRLVFVRDVLEPETKENYAHVGQEVAVVATRGGEPKTLSGSTPLTLTQNGYQPEPQLALSGDGERVLYTELLPATGRGDLKNSTRYAWQLDSADLKGGVPRVEATLRGLSVQGIPSPDARWLAIQSAFNIVLRPMPVRNSDAQAPRIALAGPAKDPELIAVTTLGGTDPEWSADGKTLSWSWTNQRYSAPLAELIKPHAGEPVTRALVASVSMTVPRPFPTNSLLLRNARIITMSAVGMTSRTVAGGNITAATDPGVIDCGDLLITGRRIVAVGVCGTVLAPRDATSVDLHGKTLMPGLVPLHEHRWFPPIPAEQPLGLALMLAHGITTARDPGTGYHAFLTQELVDAGQMIGPRWFGELVYFFDVDVYPGGEELASLQDAYDAVDKHKSAGATIIKEYFKPHRIQRQWLAMAAAHEGVRLTSDQGFETDRFITEVEDGYSGFEHALNTCDVAPDVTGLFGRLGITYDPQLSFTPELATLASAYLKAHPRRWWGLPTQTAPDREGYLLEFNLAPKPSSLAVCRAQVARDFLRAGANVVFGTDVELSGLIQHERLWSYASGDLSNAEILRIGTLDGARGIGVDHDLGSLEVGKIADLIVLNSNPLDSIFNTVDIHQVIKDGVVYDGDTLDTLWPRQKKFAFYR